MNPHKYKLIDFKPNDDMWIYYIQYAIASKVLQLCKIEYMCYQKCYNMKEWNRNTIKDDAMLVQNKLLNIPSTFTPGKNLIDKYK